MLAWTSILLCGSLVLLGHFWSPYLPPCSTCNIWSFASFWTPLTTLISDMDNAFSQISKIWKFWNRNNKGRVWVAAVAMYRHQIKNGGRNDLIQLYQQIVHQNDGISMRNWLKLSPPAFCIYHFSCLGRYCFRPITIGQNTLAAVANNTL